MANQFDADSGILWSARPGRNHDTVRPHRLDFTDGDFVVAPHLNLRAQFSKILDKVVSERVVIVENEDHLSILNAS